MDKLYTALNLIKLLNENKKINSIFVAEKLEVSKRTAQRFLLGLSSLPGVIYDEKDYSYSLVDSNKFEDAFLSQSELSYVGAIFDFMKKSLNSESAKYMDQLKKKIFHINGSSFTFDALNDNTIDFENISATLSLLEKNIIENMQITFSYKRTEKDYKVKPGKGGRHKAYMSFQEESEFLMPFIDDAKSGKIATVSEINRKLEEHLDHPVHKTTVYHMLKRHGWRKIVPRTVHVDSDEQ